MQVFGFDLLAYKEVLPAVQAHTVTSVPFTLKPVSWVRPWPLPLDPG
jgi:hypothetical protein